MEALLASTPVSAVISIADPSFLNTDGFAGISKMQGVNVNAIAPRVIASHILDQLYPDEKSRQELIEQIPIRRIGYPEDIGNLACFLASEKSTYIHGQIILMDGGRTYQ